jgi:large repetitive protein
VIGRISGTPQQLGDFSFVVRATAGGATVTRALTLSVVSPTPSRLTVAVMAFGDPTLTISAPYPFVFRGQFYDDILRASGPSDADWTGTVVSRDGLISCSAASGVLSGTCEAEYPFGTRVVLDAFPGAGTIAEGFSSPGCPLTYSHTRTGCAITVTGSTGVAAFFRTQRWSIVSGSLPNGLEFDARTGRISGEPLLAPSGTYTVTFRVTAGGQSAETTVSFQVV